MGPDWLILEKISCQVTQNCEFQHMVLGKTPKYRYFSKIRQIIALKETLTNAFGGQISHNMNIM
jgi:hypothetical protein